MLAGGACSVKSKAGAKPAPQRGPDLEYGVQGMMFNFGLEILWSIDGNWWMDRWFTSTPTSTKISERGSLSVKRYVGKPFAPKFSDQKRRGGAADDTYISLRLDPGNTK
ncbi:uncharacterized protein DFL_001360 [Arthrobotrys flagrans]|uniref:Uncharacterized protein n=1 Tax=Arthrobotrys flagrans TaxID=97331 RepID=A0A437AGX8_ARTFL|nr:hypothetical protein DFL_001360 [Arthrobotrys flagrans]